MADRLLRKRRIVKRETPRKVNGPCWEWKGGRNSDGYGVIRMGRRIVYVHRLAAAVWNGFDIDSELFICHNCNNNCCFNPDHLREDTQAENNRDIVRDQKWRKNVLSNSDIRRLIHAVDCKGMSIARWAAGRGVKYCTAYRAYNGLTEVSRMSVDYEAAPAAPEPFDDGIPF